MLLHHIRCVLDRVARLLIGSRLLQDVRRQDVSQIMWPVRQQALEGAATGIWIIDAVSLDDRSPSLVELRGVVSRIVARRLHRLDEERARILRIAEQHTAMAVDIGLQVPHLAQRARNIVRDRKRASLFVQRTVQEALASLPEAEYVVSPQ